MARRRYISTAISTDTVVRRLAKEYGDFAVMLYTWMIPHAEDDGKLTGNIEEFAMLVVPGFRWKTNEEIEHALNGMVACGLVSWDREKEVISFPESFFIYQSYITQKRREKQEQKKDNKAQKQLPQDTTNQRKSAQISANQRKSALRLSSSSCSSSCSSSSSSSEKQKQYPLNPPKGEVEEKPLELPPSEKPEEAEPLPIPSRPPEKSPREGVPYNEMALAPMYECSKYVPNFAVDTPSDIRFLQELGQEYPQVNLLAEFRKARDWLISALPKKRPKKDLKAFLRNWVSNAVNKYGVGQPRVIGYETVTEFVPIPEGGGADAGTM